MRAHVIIIQRGLDILAIDYGDLYEYAYGSFKTVDEAKAWSAENLIPIGGGVVECSVHVIPNEGDSVNDALHKTT